MTDPASFSGGPFQTNGYLLECGEQSVLFDAPLGIVNRLKSQNITLDLLILTHLHHDHIMDAALAVDTFDCPVWSHSDVSEDLILKSSLVAATGQEWDIRHFPIARHLKGGESFEIEGRQFDVLHIPGHSPDSLCFHEQATKIVIGGDVLFQGGIGRTDFPNGSFDQLISGIKEKLWPLPNDTVVYPGHGQETTIGCEKGTNPFVQ